MPTLVIAGTITIDPARRDAFAEAAVEMMEETHKEPGNVAYAFSADFADDGVIRIFEQWESQEALDAHMKSPHMAAFQGKLGGLGIRGMDMQKYVIESFGPLF